jgi:hypothetical protein
MDCASEAVLLKPVTFQYKTDKQAPQFGLIADKWP